MTMTMTSAALLDCADNGSVGSDDLSRPRRRRFTAEYKLALLAEYEGLADPGAKGALLRREGLYSSHIAEWRRARAAGALAGLAARARPARTSPAQRELERLRARNERLEAELQKHRLALEIQGKASELLERLLAEGERDRQRP